MNVYDGPRTGFLVECTFYIICEFRTRSPDFTVLEFVKNATGSYVGNSRLDYYCGIPSEITEIESASVPLRFHQDGMVCGSVPFTGSLIDVPPMIYNATHEVANGTIRKLREPYLCNTIVQVANDFFDINSFAHSFFLFLSHAISAIFSYSSEFLLTWLEGFELLLEPILTQVCAFVVAVLDTVLIMIDRADLMPFIYVFSLYFFAFSTFRPTNIQIFLFVVLHLLGWRVFVSHVSDQY